MSGFSRRSLLTTSSLATAGAALGQNQPPRPNILFLCSDQHTGSALGCSGHPVVRTPHLDRLAARGVNYRYTYCGSPVCAPGRASLMTGMFASDVGSYCNSTPFDGRVPSWGNRLRDAGYYCWATGKLDLWKDKDFGFHEVATSHGHSQGPDITSLFRSPVCFRPKERNVVNGSFSDREPPDLPKVQHAVRFLRQESRKVGRPWAMYVGLVKPHPKFDAATRFREVYSPDRMPLPSWPEGYLERRHTMFQVLANFKNISNPVPEERVRRARAAYFGMITELDELIGRILDELERSGQADNTLVVYTSDHGEMLGEHGLWLKNVLLEGAARVPLVVAGPGVPAGRTVDTPVAHVDLIATLLEAAGLEAAGGGRFQGQRGHSLLPLARGQSGDHPGFAFSESNSEGNCTGSFLIRQAEWKYLYFTSDEPLLFNLKEDPGEFRNLAGNREYRQIERQLQERLTSLLDPDAVTEAAFRRQAQVLDQIAGQHSRQEFYQMMEGRLGSAQARVVTMRQYRA